MRTYLATQNAGKAGELKAILAAGPLRLVVPRKLPNVAEDAETYAGNALLKAQALANALRRRHVSAAVLADDSGLEVDALDGAPGPLSARFGGAELDWPARRALLLGELRGVPPYRRSARFVCTLALLQPECEPIVATGEVRGYILEGERGTGGFGYDSVFLYPPLGQSFAALTQKAKNEVSHRRRAADALLAMLRDRSGQPTMM